MSLLAGMRITAARLWRSQGSTTLSTGTPAAVSTFYQWGSEEVTFDNPGVAVDVTAQLTGRNIVSAGAAASTSVQVRLGVSTDGGTTWTYGNTPPLNIWPGGSGALASGSSRTPMVASVGVFGVVPTGNIVVRAEYSVTDLNCSMQNGYITALAMAS